MSSPLFTVFTPTFERAGYLPKILDALKRQTLSDFEWVIVDDGSSDNTIEVVKELIERNELNIIFKPQQVNRGKHVCYDVALECARGEFFIPLDSDDVPTPNALASLYEAYMDIPVNDREGFSAVTGLCVDQTGKVIGDKFPQDVFDSDPLELLYKHSISGDKWGFQRTEIRRRYGQPIKPDPTKVGGMKFYPEIAIFGQIALDYKTRYINVPVKVVEYHEEGLSLNKKAHAYPKKISALFQLNYCFRYATAAPKHFVMLGILYNRWSLHSKSWKLSEIKGFGAKCLVLATLPAGILAFLLDR